MRACLETSSMISEADVRSSCSCERHMQSCLRCRVFLESKIITRITYNEAHRRPQYPPRTSLPRTQRGAVLLAKGTIAGQSSPAPEAKHVHHRISSVRSQPSACRFEVALGRNFVQHLWHNFPPACTRYRGDMCRNAKARRHSRVIDAGCPATLLLCPSRSLPPVSAVILDVLRPLRPEQLPGDACPLGRLRFAASLQVPLLREHLSFPPQAAVECSPEARIIHRTCPHAVKPRFGYTVVYAKCRCFLTSSRRGGISHHLHTPALLMTWSNSDFLTPLPTPAPPFASRTISRSRASSTSSLSTAATLFRCATVMTPPPPPPSPPAGVPVNSAKASSTSRACASEVWSRAWSFRAHMATKEG